MVENIVRFATSPGPLPNVIRDLTNRPSLSLTICLLSPSVYLSRMSSLVAPVRSAKNPIATSVSGVGAACPLLLPNPNQLQHPVKKQELGDRNGRWVHHYLSYRAPLHRHRPLLLARRRPQSNVNEDTDEMFDDLLEKYGEVVFRRNDQKPPSAEADDDAESLSFAVALAKVASDVKAGDIRVLFVKPLVYWTRFFIIATAFSRPQIDAIGSRIRDLAEKQYEKVASGDMKPNSWTLLDFGDVVVHIFLPEQREFYNLEEFYGNAIPIELPFEQSSFRS